MAKSKDAAILRQARDRFERCKDWEADSRKAYIADRKFANADSDNLWQWDDDPSRARLNDNRPCLTINKTRQHNLQIINDARQNKPSIKIAAVSTGATYKAAQVMESLVRHIEYISNAQAVYDRATVFQVEAGIGYWRVVTDYADDESLDQEIFIRSIKDPLSIYMDPDILEMDGSDANFAIVFDDITHDECKAKYSQFEDVIPGDAPLGNGTEIGRAHV